MQKILLSVLFLMFAAFAANAQVATQQQPVNPNAPEISFDKLVHDYGTIVQGSDGGCEFKFTNTGKEPLILSKPITSCGCTTSSWPQEPILPGKSDVIKVNYNTNNIGPVNKTVTVNSNGKTATVRLTIKGTVVAKPATTTPEKPNEQGATPVSK
ncbi:MAG: DUF1573 domain-containing protein [Bacteroidetes bacterium]|nr:DUF1573 domain-containing protein [Bacteroidota bacterium]